MDTTKKIKQLLQKNFPNWKFSVRRGTGTAWSWITVTVFGAPEVPNLEGFVDFEDRQSVEYKNRKKMEILAASVDGVGTYFCDDGMGTPRKEILFEYRRSLTT